MKRYILIIAMLGLAAVVHPAKSQVNVSVNIGLQPLWGPVGYDYVEYYYFPSYEVYYYVPTAQFVYLNGGNWIFAAALPPSFGTINYYSTYKVVINQPKAYLSFNTHKVKYKGGGKQVVIRDSREPKYFVVKGHPNYGQAKKEVKGTPAPKSVQEKKSPGNYKSTPAPKGNPGGGGGNKGGGQGKGKK